MTRRLHFIKSDEKLWSVFVIIGLVISYGVGQSDHIKRRLQTMNEWLLKLFLIVAQPLLMTYYNEVLLM
jgi:hypothetical protein